MPADAGPQGVLYLHGGAYCVGSPATHRAVTSHLARAASIPVFAIDYRLAPENPFPAATDDALEAYRWLLDNGYAASDIFIAGDSAGGGLTLATALQIRELSLPTPAGLILLSPWADLTHPEKTAANQPDDVMLSWATLEHSERLYEKMTATNTMVRLSLYQQMWHVFPAHAGMLTSADLAISEMAEWITGSTQISPAAN